MPDPTQSSNHVSGIASAPGDLPLSMLRERDQSRSLQFRHDNLIEPMAPRPNQPVTITATSGAAMLIQRAEVWYTTDGRLPDATSCKASMVLADVTWAVEMGYINHWQATLPPQPTGTTVRYRIAGYTSAGAQPSCFAHDGSGFWFRYGAAGVTTFAYRVQDRPFALPAWMDDAVIYHIVLDRFRNDSPDGVFAPGLGPQDQHGGTLRGVLNALPYLSELGVNCLWLSPLGPSDSYHRYDQRDFFAVDPKLGTLDDVRALVAAAQARGMRLILDYVPSHASYLMPEFVAAQQDAAAPSASWFVFDEWPHKYRSFLGMVPSLVSFNGNDEGLRRYLIDSARFWLCEMGFDGLRLDHAVGHGTDFWVAFSTALEEAKPDVAIFGEVTETPDVLRRYAGRLQGVLDFPLAQILRMSFGRGDWDVTELGGALAAYTQFMQNGPGRVAFIDNHDMDRFLFVAGNDVRRLKLAALCLFTLPVPPTLYYGTEIGLTQLQDKDAGGYGGDHVIRGDMPWNPAQWNTELLAFFTDLIGLRHQQPALRTGHWQSLLPDPAQQVYGYTLEQDGTHLLVLFNLGETRQQVPLAAGQTCSLLFSTQTSVSVSADGVSLDGLAGVVLSMT